MADGESFLEEETRIPTTIPKTVRAIKSNFWLVAKWHWLDANCDLVKRIVRWRWPFDQDEIVEDLFEASITADYSNLPTTKDILDPESFTDLFSFLRNNLSLSDWEMDRILTLSLEGLENDWTYEFMANGKVTGRWLFSGMESTTKSHTQNGLYDCFPYTFEYLQ